MTLRTSAVAHAAELTLPAAEKAPAWLYTLHRTNMGDLEYIHKAGEPQSPFRDDILAGRVVLIVSTDQCKPGPQLLPASHCRGDGPVACCHLPPLPPCYRGRMERSFQSRCPVAGTSLLRLTADCCSLALALPTRRE